MSDNLPREVVEANEHLLRDAQRWQAFPTDDDVEAGAGALSKNDGIEVLDWHRDLARAVLEAVKREDFDRNVGLGGERMDYGPQVKREDR